MATTPEGRVKAAVKKLLASYPCYTHWPVTNGMGAPTLDCVGCYKGMYFAIETKAPGKKPTLRQEGTIDAIRGAKGKAFVIDGSEESMALLRTWLEEA